jgi:hypothetical protein
MFSLMWFLQEHTKNHADGSPNGGPTKTHHVKGLKPFVDFGLGFLAGLGEVLVRSPARVDNAR